MTQATLALGMPGPLEMIVIAAFGLLIFGRRLPEVGKGLARSIVEFKKGLREVTDEMDTASVTTPKARPLQGPAEVTYNAVDTAAKAPAKGL